MYLDALHDYFNKLEYDIRRAVQTRDSYLITSSAARGVVILFPTLGLAWGFGVIAVNHDALVWKYLFAIFTSLQVRTPIIIRRS